MIALCVMYIPNCMIFYFCITWLPTYLRQRHGFDATSLGIFAGLPLIVSMPGDLLGGAGRPIGSVSRYGLRVGRCGLGAVAYVIAGVALLAAAASSTPVLAATLIALATGMTMFTLGAAWGTVIEVGRNHVGVVGATMNSVGNLAAMLNPLIVAYSVQWFGNWNLPLYLMGALFLVGAFCWTLVDPSGRSSVKGRCRRARPLPAGPECGGDSRLRDWLHDAVALGVRMDSVVGVGRVHPAVRHRHGRPVIRVDDALGSAHALILRFRSGMRAVGTVSRRQQKSLPAAPIRPRP